MADTADAMVVAEMNGIALEHHIQARPRTRG